MTMLPGISNRWSGLLHVLNLRPNTGLEKADLETVDRFDAPIMLSTSVSESALVAVRCTFKKVDAHLLTTLCVLDSSSLGGRRARSLQERLCAVNQDLRTLQEVFDEGSPVANTRFVNLRRALWEIETAIFDLQCEHISDSLKSCSSVTRAKIEALAVMQALQDGDIAFVKMVLKAYPPSRAKKPNKTDVDLLRRFDSHLLKSFAEKGLVISISYEDMEIFRGYADEISELQAFQKIALQQLEDIEKRITTDPGQVEEIALYDLREAKESALKNIGEHIETIYLEQAELEKAYYLRDNYYLIDNPHLQLFRRLATLFDEAGIPIACMRSLNFQVMKALFRGHFEMFCAFGVIERLSQAELGQRALQGLCDVRDYLAVGRQKCQIHRAGILALKNAVQLNPPRYVPEPKLPEEKEQHEPEPVIEPPRVRNYRIVHLDQSVEFY